MRKNHLKKAMLCAGVLSSVSAAPVVLKNSEATIEATKLPWHPERIVIASDGSAGLKEKTEDLTKIANCDLWDLFFQFAVDKPGRYGITVSSIIDDFGKTLIPGWNRAGLTFCGRFRIDQEIPTFRNIAAPWLPADNNQYHVGNFYFEKGIHSIAMQMPRGFRVKSVKIAWAPVAAVPEEVPNYKPAIVPSTPHPRVWVNAEVLPGIRAGLQTREHRDLYAAIRNRAVTPYKFDPAPGSTVPPDTALENAVIEKAFVYLMEKDPAMGKEAAQLMSRYFDSVDFGNRLDVAREMGAAIYAASLVYDWCYELLTPGERRRMREKMLLCAAELETSWPPFDQTVIIGHGNEWQLCRDLLAMAIAVYDEDPVPYQYLAWHILEQLLPMRDWQYQSPRHNQGTNYGYLRYGCDLHAALMLERMAGRAIFHPRLYSVIDFWTYMRLPDGDMLPCGDGRIDRKYWKYPLTTMLAQAGSRSAQVKGEMMRQQSLKMFPMMALLFNDPAGKADKTFDSMPLTIDFGTILGGMVARTGWDLRQASGDVVAEIRGGGYIFGNHQHSDAGALQLYYLGHQIVDLGQYRFYGTPYDYNFNKRSAAHSMMLVTDPAEKFFRDTVNDGGTPFNQDYPCTPEETMTTPKFRNGTVRYCAFGPDRMAPDVSVFSADLASAYAGKVKKLVRTFLFWNNKNDRNPASMILLDRVQSKNPQFRKVCQINTAGKPEITENTIRFSPGKHHGRIGHTYLTMLYPQADNRKVQILSGKDSTSVAGMYFEPPLPKHWSSRGHRIQITPGKAAADDLFVQVIQLCPDEETPPQIESRADGDNLQIAMNGRAAVMNIRGDFFSGRVSWDLPDGEWQLTVTDLAPGTWQLENCNRVFTVEKGKNIAILNVSGGKHSLKQIGKE